MNMFWLTSTHSYLPHYLPQWGKWGICFILPHFSYIVIYSKDIAALYFKWFMIMYVMLGKISDAPHFAPQYAPQMGRMGRMFIAPHFSYIGIYSKSFPSYNNQQKR